MRTADAVVIGAGAVGLATARRLARDGLRVIVVERDRHPGAASRAAAGMLAAQAEAAEPDAFFELLRAARDGYPAFVADLQEETGLALDFRRDGLLAIESDLAAETELARRVEWQRAAGLRVEELDVEAARRRWPAVSLPPPGDASGDAAEGRVFHFPDEAQVDSDRLMEGLLAACAQAGAEVRMGAEARGLRREQGRVTGVDTAEGRITAPLAVNAAGAWAGAVSAWAGETLPVEPVRGEMLAYESAAALPRPIVVSGGAYCLLRAGGRLLVGATAERAGFVPSVTDEGQAWLEAHARRLAPEATRRGPSERWAGLRPGTPDDLPVLGPSAVLAGLVHATGHYRNGILLAQITAELVAGLVAGDDAAGARAAPFAPARSSLAAGRS